MMTVRNIAAAAAALFFTAASLLNFASGYLMIPDPPLATPLTEETYEDFLRSEDKVGIVFQYPSSPVLGAINITEFAIVTKILENNPKCKLGIYQVNLTMSSSAEAMKPSLSYMRNGEVISFTGNVGKIAEVLGWITKERICEMRLSNKEMTRYYVKSLEQGYVHTYLLLNHGVYTDKIVKQVYDTVLGTGLRVPFMVADDEEIIKYVLKLYRLREDAVEQNAVLVARNIATLNSMQFYLQPLDDKSKLRSFLLQEMIPPVHGTNSYMLDELFTMDKILVYIYTKNEDLESCIDVKWLNKFARKHNDRFLFIHSKGDETVEQRLNQLLAIDADYVDTAVRAFQLHRERSEFVKYKPLDMKDGFLSQAKLMNFVSDLRKGRIRHFVKSEPAVPEHIDVGRVKTIVGEDFNHRVMESDEDVLILFYSPWCGHCHHAKRVFRELGRRVHGIDSLVVAMFDAFNNEVESMSFSTYPVIMLYPHGAKNEPVTFHGDIAIEPLAEFLQRECRKRYVNSSSILNRGLSEEQLFEKHTEL